MKYSSNIALVENGRGCFSLDPIVGCSPGMALNEKGCYGDCYAASYSKRYGYDFSESQKRYFEHNEHRIETVNKINTINMPFVRMGTSGDPSIDWDHTLSVIKDISLCNKAIVITTKHWNILTEDQIEALSGFGVCVNTSISALDSDKLIERRLNQYKRLKFYCKSVLRIVSCDFNKDNPTGERLSIIQDELFKNEETIDTVFRPSGNNEYVLCGVINTNEAIFMGGKCLASQYNSNTHLGYCNDCADMCGAHGCSRDNQIGLFK